MIRELRGFDESDLADGGSDRFVDALVVAGDVDTVVARVQEQLSAGADHVCVSIATADPRPVVGLPALRELAPALV
jgi:alkanesulfonate monooxygenase SsuD/methylene tetrahydromethanopterin reductase-like flavin-dependent oxidoreductase (luciferase family)